MNEETLGCLHPSTALKLFNSFPLSSILHFGLEVVFPSNSEIKMLEHCQLTILHSILGLPSRAPPCVALHYHLGTLPMRLIIKSHLHSAISKAILLLRVDASLHGCFLHINSIFQELDLPSVVELLNSIPSKQAWKTHIKSTTLLFTVSDNLVSAALQGRIEGGSRPPILSTQKKIQNCF